MAESLQPRNMVEREQAQVDEGNENLPIWQFTLVQSGNSLKKVNRKVHGMSQSQTTNHSQPSTPKGKEKWQTHTQNKQMP